MSGFRISILRVSMFKTNTLYGESQVFKIDKSSIPAVWTVRCNDGSQYEKEENIKLDSTIYNSVYIGKDFINYKSEQECKAYETCRRGLKHAVH